MKIDFERSGGFAGMIFSTSIDTEKMAAEDARQIESLVASSGFFDLPEKITSPTPGADRFVYRLSVEHAGRRHQVEVTESAVPEELDPLIRHLSLLARPRR